jgi:hypothetical protein
LHMIIFYSLPSPFLLKRGGVGGGPYKVVLCSRARRGKHEGLLQAKRVTSCSSCCSTSMGGNGSCCSTSSNHRCKTCLALWVWLLSLLVFVCVCVCLCTIVYVYAHVYSLTTLPCLAYTCSFIMLPHDVDVHVNALSSSFVCSHDIGTTFSTPFILTFWQLFLAHHFAGPTSH